jgi:hypothetical protein
VNPPAILELRRARSDPVGETISHTSMYGITTMIFAARCLITDFPLTDRVLGEAEKDGMVVAP